MRHLPYSKPTNPWATGQMQTMQKSFQWATKREPRPTMADSLEFFKYEQMIWRIGRKPNRDAVGVIRAMGAQHFFNGCYEGAEND